MTSAVAICALVFAYGPQESLAATITMPPDDGVLQATIDDAEPGDTLVLWAGATYTGPATLMKKDGDPWITIQPGYPIWRAGGDLRRDAGVRRSDAQEGVKP